VTSVLPVVLAILVLLLVSRPGDSAMFGRGLAHRRAQGSERGHGEVGRSPRQPLLANEAAARLPHPPTGTSRTRRWSAEPDGPEDLDDLVERARAGDPEAFGILFDRYHGPVFRQLLAQTRSRALAEDLTSETFFKALRAVNGFALPSRLFGPWLRRIARNLAADHFKASRTRLEHVTSDLSYFEDLVASPEDIVVQRVDHQALREALRRLPVNQQRAVTLRFLGELSITETAEILGCSEGAAKQLQWRGLRNLSNLLRDEVRRT
jgi:RNA polymerase sigma-70 factor (ECF subfamily)